MKSGSWTMDYIIVFAFWQISDRVDSVSLHPRLIEYYMVSVTVKVLAHVMFVQLHIL